jgi:hypothetical protein
MGVLTVPQVIEIGDISTYLSGNYVDEGQIWGARLNQEMHKTILMVTDALRWQWESFPDVAEVRAVGSFTITDIGDDGDNIAVWIEDPDLGLITLGNYTKTSADTTTDILTNKLFLAIQNNPYGYQVLWNSASTITLIAREGTGARINNANHLQIIITETITQFVSTEVPIPIMTQSGLKITTELY